MDLAGLCWLGVGPSGPSQGPLAWLPGVGVGGMGKFFYHLKLHSGRSCPMPNSVDLAMPRVETGWRGTQTLLSWMGEMALSSGNSQSDGEAHCLWGIASLMRESQLWPGKALKLGEETPFLSCENPHSVGGDRALLWELPSPMGEHMPCTGNFGLEKVKYLQTKSCPKPQLGLDPVSWCLRRTLPGREGPCPPPEVSKQPTVSPTAELNSRWAN